MGPSGMPKKSAVNECILKTSLSLRGNNDGGREGLMDGMEAGTFWHMGYLRKYLRLSKSGP